MATLLLVPFTGLLAFGQNLVKNNDQFKPYN